MTEEKERGGLCLFLCVGSYETPDPKVVSGSASTSSPTFSLGPHSEGPFWNVAGTYTGPTIEGNSWVKSRSPFIDVYSFLCVRGLNTKVDCVYAQFLAAQI